MQVLKILLAEDDTNLGLLTRDFLELEGYEVKLCRDGESALHAYEQFLPDLCLLDVMMPKMDGFELAEKLQTFNQHLPIIFLTAKSLKEDKLQGFQLGADDYITKPFDEDELLARIQAVLKRSKPRAEVYQIGKIEFTPQTQTLKYQNGEKKRMTARENEVLLVLAEAKNQLVRREDALMKIWGKNDYFHGRSFDVFITKLRKYLKPDPEVCIENLHGVGFILRDRPES